MADKLLKRKDVPVEDTWRLEDIYASDDAWEKEFTGAKALCEALKGYEGRLDNAGTMLEALRAYYGCEQIIASLFTYAKMRQDEDNQNAVYQALLARAQGLTTEFATAVSYIAPELLALPEGALEAAQADPAFADYSMYLDDLIRQRPHTLNKAEEKLVAMTGDMGASPQNIYGMLNNADMRFPEITDEDGKSVRVTHANYIPFMMSRSCDVRRQAFDALYSTYKSYSSTVPAIYAASVRKDVFYARAGKYQSALESKLYPDNVPQSVYDNLILAVNEHLGALQRFVSVNAKLNGVSDMHFYDLYLAPELGFDIKLPFDKAYDMVVDCLHVLGDEYQTVLRQAKAERWIDPYENEGKSSGAYSWGTYASHPYVLINYKPDLDHLQTIAHEMGHSLHTWYSNQQPYPKSEYSLFVAEVASTVNEVLVLMELMDRHPEKNAQAYLLYNLLDSFRGTVFRQTMFAEFEKRSHEMAENGEPLTVDTLNGFYGELNRKYYANLSYDELIAYEWMRIPHFYRSFYVYKYATGFSAAMAIAGMIRSEGAPAVKRYQDFLRAGGSLYPIDALKLAGVDMASPEPVRRALDEFDRLLERYEQAIR